MGGFAREVLEHAVLVPGAVAAVATWLGAWLLRDRSIAVACAVALGFLSAFELIRGFELTWPRSATDKLPVAVLIGLAGTLIAGRRHLTLAGTLVAIAGPVVLVAARPLANGQVFTPLLAGLAGVALWQVSERGPAGRLAWLLTTVALGLAGTALFARAVLLAELSLAAGAVVLATLVRPAPDARALLPVAALLIAVATTLALFSKAPAAALLLIGAIPLTGRISGHLARNVALREPVLFWLLPLILATLATAWARWVAGPPLYFG